MMALFSWVPFHRELARRVLDFEHERGRMIELHHRQVDFGLWEKPKTDAKVEKVQEPLFDIDPFSFFATFIVNRADEKRLKYLAWLKDELGLVSDAPLDVAGLPTADNQKTLLFSAAWERPADDINALWRLARPVALGEPIEPALFVRCLGVKNVALTKLTQALFWLDPNRFLPVDKKTRPLLEKDPKTNAALAELEADRTLPRYEALLDTVRARIDHDLLAVSHRAWLESTETRWKRQPATAMHGPRNYWLGGHQWGDVSQAERFKQGRIWEMGFADTDSEPRAQLAWERFRQIRAGDYVAIKGFGGNYHLTVYLVGEVVRILPGARRLELRPLDVELHDGKGFRGRGAGNQMSTVVPVKRPDVIEEIFFRRREGKGDDDGDDTLGAGLIEREEVLRHLLGALATRPLVLLAGVSGSGKTQLAARIGRAWAEGLGAEGVSGLFATLSERLGITTRDGWAHVPDAIPPDEDPDAEAADDHRFALAPVRADWHEAASLWGWLHHDKGEFHGTPALSVVLDAWRKAAAGETVNHVLVLDEMNLARIEHYGSDLLSAMERQGEPMIQLHSRHEDVPLAGEPGRTVPSRIGWPRGLRIIGTVNVDETTFAFAPKVLDRAAVLEFLDIDLERLFRDTGRSAIWSRLGPFFEAVQAATRPHALHLGYRAALEIASVVGVHLGTDPGGWEESRLGDILDLQLRNKVLPRVRGPRGAVEDVLLELLALARAGTVAAARQAMLESLRDWRDRGYPVEADGPAAAVVFPRACEKATAMLSKARFVGFTSFF